MGGITAYANRRVPACRRETCGRAAAIHLEPGVLNICTGCGGYRPFGRADEGMLALDTHDLANTLVEAHGDVERLVDQIRQRVERWIANDQTLLMLEKLANKGVAAIVAAKQQAQVGIGPRFTPAQVEEMLGELQQVRHVLREIADESRDSQRLLLLVKEWRGETMMSIGEFTRVIV